MATALTDNPTTFPNLAAVEEVIIALLGEALGRDPAGVRADVSRAGALWPIDSLLAVEILCDLEDQFGVRLPEDTLTADSLRSVRLLARRICDVGAADAALRVGA